jgi:NADP-dependent 3-hydroxy acid dehydrogenase YdfG
MAVDSSKIGNKTAIVTGRADSIGEAYARALVAAGVKVVVGDLDSANGRILVSELSGVKFIQCDTTVPQYSATKWAMRGIMHALRRTAFTKAVE